MGGCPAAKPLWPGWKSLNCGYHRTLNVPNTARRGASYTATLYTLKAATRRNTRVRMLGLVLALAPHAWGHQITLPELNTVLPFHFSKPYSCSMSYNTSALFLSSASLERASPELLYNGPCDEPSYFQASTAGDDFSLIADVGELDIVNATSSRAFSWPNVVGKDNTFKNQAAVVVNHLYAVLLTKSEFRALFWVKVSADFKPNRPHGGLDITYAVRSYSVTKEVEASPGYTTRRAHE